MIKPTKGQWENMRRELSGALGRADLKIDGFDVSLHVEIHSMKLVIAVYVDGGFKGMWLTHDCDQRRRFMHERKSYVWSAKDRKSRTMIKLIGKEKLTRQVSFYYPWFTSFRTLKSHLIKNNENIKVLRIGYGEQNTGAPSQK